MKLKLRCPTVLLTAVSMLGGACAPTIGGVPGDPDRSPDVVVVGGPSGPRILRTVPPGHYPPPGECRLWLPGRPPGQQPPPTRCGGLVGRVPLGAFVLYNANAWDADYDWRAHERRNPGSVPRTILDVLKRRGKERGRH